MLRLYAMPIVGVGTRQDPRRPAHVDDFFAPNGIDWSMMDFGNQPVCLVAADVSNALNPTLQAFQDVSSLPDNLDQTLGAQLNNVKNAFEAFNIPAQWMDATMTYRSILKTTAAIFQYLQALQALLPGAVLIGGSVTLSTTFGSLSANAKTAMQAAAFQLGLNTTGVNNSTTMRSILTNISQQSQLRSYFIGGFTL